MSQRRALTTETAILVIERLAADPDVWATHGIPSTAKMGAIVAGIERGMVELLEKAATLAEAQGAEWDDDYCENADTYDPVAMDHVATASTARYIAKVIRGMSEPKETQP